ncbi:MAG: DUF853 family protein [Erysipelotrichia bacterium]|nr:DUF853 family protein [Erysipelotrichia bacterium]
MIKEGRILLGKAEDKEIYIEPRQMNRHGFIAGASGTGKTVTLKVIAESLSELGVPTVIADVKGDLSGMIISGDQAAITGRLESMKVSDDFKCRNYPVHFFDVYGKNGHPIRATIEQMGSVFLSRIMGLSDAQQGILNIIFKAAADMDLNIIDLKDLQAMTEYVGQHAAEYTVSYGNVTKQSIGAIQRRLLELDSEGGDIFFGQPALDIHDWISSEGGLGVMNILECQQLFQHPLLYATFLLWMLNELYEKLPETGDLDKPRIVFFFDEAHTLFDEAPKQLTDKIEQTVKLIRSKGVGIYFITQSPADIPGDILAQLSNRIEHSLRAYTPAEIKAVKQAADSFRPNPAFNSADLISNMKTGTALVSVLDAEGAPTIVEHTKILPPKSSMSIADASMVSSCILHDNLYGKYGKSFDAASAYEGLDEVRKSEAAEAEKAEASEREAKLQYMKEKEEMRAEVKREKEKSERGTRLAKKMTNRIENEAINIGIRSAKKFLKGFLK